MCIFMLTKIIPQKDLKLIITILLFFNSINSFAQSNDAYLNALQGEAADLTLDQQTKNKNTPTLNPIPTQVEPTISTGQNNSPTNEDGKVPSGLSIEAFTNHIKANYFGTFIFMKRLNVAQKQEIYNFYTQNNDPQAIRSKVLSVSKKK